MHALRQMIGKYRLDGPRFVAYVMILISLVTFVWFPPAIAAWQIGLTIVALLAMFALNSLPDSWWSWAGSQDRAEVWFFFFSITLFLIAFAFAATAPVSLVPFLMFLLIGQMTFSLSLARFIVALVVLFVSTSAILWWQDGSAQALNWLWTVIPGTLFTIVFTSLTRQANRQAERANRLLEQLQVAHAELELAREREKELAVAEERVRLAREIHDGLGHHLTVLHVQLQAAEKLVNRDPERAAKAIGISRTVAQAALDDVRQSVSSLHQSPLDGRSLEQALVALVKAFEERAGITTRLELIGQLPALSSAATMTLYRAAQEGLTNVHKHANAQHALVRVQLTPQHVLLQVDDDGDGQGHGDGAGFGFTGLRQRAEQLGGTFAAAPLPSGGFRLELTVPLATKEALP